MECSLPAQVRLVQKKGQIPWLEITNKHARASVALQGAHVFAFQPARSRPLIWLSDYVDFKPGTALRGGIPICWPWFGAGESGQPAHGFARTANWTLSQCSSTDFETRLTFDLPKTVLASNGWHGFSLQYRVTVGEQLTIELITANHSNSERPLTQALHTYMDIEDIHQTTVAGFEDCLYFDSLSCSRHRQDGRITFQEEVDRIYYHDPNTPTVPVSELHCPSGTIAIEHINSHSAVVWNPWVAKSKTLSNFGDDEYQTMVCVETANAGDDCITLAPGHSTVLAARYGWQ